MLKFNVGVIGATGMVGQRFLTILDKHPWFNVKVLAASTSSANKFYEEAVRGRWKLQTSIPQRFKEIVVLDAVKDIKNIAEEVDFIFCAVNMSKSEIKNLEECYAKLDCPVISNNSANRFGADIPMIIPEINPNHAEIIECQRKRLGVKRGFIAVKSNCSIQSYVPAISPLLKFMPTNILACTYQAVSGAGRTLDEWEDINDNVIPYIKGEEEKSELEPLKIWGTIKDGKIVSNEDISITTQCLRVPVSDGHMAAVFLSLKDVPSIEAIKEIWENFKPEIYNNLGDGMTISIGRLRQDKQYNYKFVCLSHNTLRGAAKGAVLMAELLAIKGYF